MNPWHYQIEYKLKDYREQKETALKYLDLLDKFPLLTFGPNGAVSSRGEREIHAMTQFKFKLDLKINMLNEMKNINFT